MNISIILSTYNSEKYIKEAISSIRIQTLQNFELLIIDDFSVDNSIEIIQEYLFDERIKLVCNSSNKGLAYNLNKLIRLAKGDVIVRMDADDIAAPNRIQRIIDEFNMDPELMLIGSDCIEIDENGEELFYKAMPAAQCEIEKMIFKRNPFVHPSVAFRKEFFKEVGLYNEEFLKFQDIELWARAIVTGVKMKNINEPLLYFRITGDTKKKRSSWHAIKNEMKVSWFLIKKQKAYTKIPVAIFAKFGLRIVQKYMPSAFSEYLYKKLR